MNVYKKINMIGVHWKMQFSGGRESRKKQAIAMLPKWGKYRQFADLRGSWWKREGGVFEGGLMLWCTLCVVSMVDTSQSGRLVTLCHMFFSQYNALWVMNSIGYYKFKLHMFSKVTLNPSCRFLSFILMEIFSSKKVHSPFSPCL